MGLPAARNPSPGRRSVPGRVTLLVLLPEPGRMSPAQRRTADRITTQGRPYDIVVRTY